MYRRKSTRYLLIGLAGGFLATIAGCPFPSPPSAPAPVLASDWGATTADGVCVMITFDEDGYLVSITAQNSEGVTANLAVSGSTTTLVGSDVTVVIPVGSVTATFQGTLSADENTLDGTFTHQIVVDEELTITVPQGDITFVRGAGCGGGAEKPVHETRFTESFDDPNYRGTQDCLTCHADRAEDIMETGHWKWSGALANVAGLEGEIHGKVDLINDY